MLKVLLPKTHLLSMNCCDKCQKLYVFVLDHFNTDNLTEFRSRYIDFLGV